MHSKSFEKDVKPAKPSFYSVFLGYHFTPTTGAMLSMFYNKTSTTI